MNFSQSNRLTKKIGLVLISSSLILTGCSDKKNQEQTVYDNTPHWWYFYNGGGSTSTHYHSYVSTPSGFGVHSTSSAGGFKSAATAVSVRGGFGAHGHAATAGA